MGPPSSVLEATPNATTGILLDSYPHQHDSLFNTWYFSLKAFWNASCHLSDSLNAPGFQISKTPSPRIKAIYRNFIPRRQDSSHDYFGFRWWFASCLQWNLAFIIPTHFLPEHFEFHIVPSNLYVIRSSSNAQARPSCACFISLAELLLVSDQSQTHTLDAHLLPALDCASDSHNVQTRQKNGEYHRKLLRDSGWRGCTRGVALRTSESRPKCRPRCWCMWDVDVPCALRCWALAAQLPSRQRSAWDVAMQRSAPQQHSMTVELVYYHKDVISYRNRTEKALLVVVCELIRMMFGCIWSLLTSWAWKQLWIVIHSNKVYSHNLTAKK